ncbi:MAG: hypothetical protein HUU06_05955 [Planctomycetaceae bacterium]|nr:hypothetical protein [Planctomycetaceae bacterium]
MRRSNLFRGLAVAAAAALLSASGSPAASLFRVPLGRASRAAKSVVVGTVLYLPNIGLFYGLHDWLGISARTLALIDTTISAPLGQLTMIPMLILAARAAPPGAEATMFAIMASLMNLALSASQLFTGYLNSAFQISQENLSNLGILMITVAAIGLLPLLTLPFLRRSERRETGIGLASPASASA